MQTITINNSGVQKEEELSREQILGRYTNINIRDLRPVFLPFQVATVLPRANTVIVNLGFIKAILTKNDLLLIIHRNHDTVRQLATTIINQNKDRSSFSFVALDVLLQTKVQQMHKKVASAEKEVERILYQIKKSFSENALENLLIIKKRFSKLDARLGELNRAAEEVLEDDEDLAFLAQLGDLQHTEIESIIENFIEQMEELSGHTFRAQEDIEDTEEFITLKLNARRTAIIRADLFATMLTVIFSFLAVVVGLYGTNITNGFENTPSAFASLTLFLVIFFITATTLTFYHLRKKRLF